MTTEEALHKLEFMRNAYQKLIDENVDEGRFVGTDVTGTWKADAPLNEVYMEHVEALDMAISAMKKQEEDRWHPVAKEGEPKESGSYLLTLKNGWVTEDFYHIDYGEWGKAHQRTIYEVVAWREKPEPYTEEE